MLQLPFRSFLKLFITWYAHWRNAFQALCEGLKGCTLSDKKSIQQLQRCRRLNEAAHGPCALFNNWFRVEMLFWRCYKAPEARLENVSTWHASTALPECQLPHTPSQADSNEMISMKCMWKSSRQLWLACSQLTGWEHVWVYQLTLIEAGNMWWWLMSCSVHSREASVSVQLWLKEKVPLNINQRVTCI